LKLIGRDAGLPAGTGASDRFRHLWLTKNFTWATLEGVLASLRLSADTRWGVRAKPVRGDGCTLNTPTSHRGQVLSGCKCELVSEGQPVSRSPR
jgi:hypothetical protein